MGTKEFLLTAVTGALVAGCQTGRYVVEIRPPVAAAPVATASQDPELERVLEETRRDAEAGGLLRGISERIHLVIDGQVAFTVLIADGKANVQRGVAAGITPTLTVSVSAASLGNLRAAVADGKLDDAEVFNISYVLFVPCLRRIHQMWYFVEPGDKKGFKVDDFMHFRLKNPQGHTYHGQKVEVAATVLNVDGYFFYQAGLTGDPDIRYEFDQSEALDFYKILVYEAERRKGDGLGLLELGRRVESMLARATMYTRAWH